ncbi:hypothetical protein [Pseudodesulfovibrio sp. zrk46]|uniref:hypothetical protein n=1 Tax=Pseudodesulfovibrio sp. zrk46 TaxID=2725288 RepID=UPI001449A4AE|nr:hypothetical protein [Pseudodesulfovibrio sp. zrk46]QJB56085.1 hypothetical protein HFN16_06520 [Pseudodesulfovibrio sp. zrk46]
MRSLSLILVLAAMLPLHVHAADLGALMPDNVGDWQRVELLTGPEAQEAVDKLHGKALPAEASAVARYAKPEQKGRPAEAWVSRVSSEKEARRQTGQMVHLMYENPRSPFKNPSRLDHAGHAVYRFEGMGQSHLIWFSGDLVWWISVDEAAEQVMLDAFCK